MRTRNISISDEAYSRLAAEKKPNESFTDVINRITGKRSILELKGLLSKKEGSAMLSEINKIRVARKKRLETTAKN